jgi:hypothetical protein
MTKQYKDGDLQVWFETNLCETIRIDSNNVHEVIRTINILKVVAKSMEGVIGYHYGLDVFDENYCGWTKWYNNQGETINEVMSK